MVESVEGFESKLDVLMLRNVDVLVKGNVEVIKPRPVDGVPGGAANARPRRRRSEGRRVEPVIRVPADGVVARVADGCWSDPIGAVPARDVDGFESAPASE